MNRVCLDIAVIIVNWNSGPLVAKCLAALYEQAVAPKRVIVVDNASSDGSADDLDDAYPGMEAVRLESNAGFAAANNIGARMAADCRWLALLNPDAFPEPDWLRKIAEAAEANPGYSFFSSRMHLAGDPEILDGTGDVYHVSGRVWRRDHGVRAERAIRESGEVFSACAAAAMYRTADFLDAGGFDESYFCYSEDMDLGFRLRLMGRKCLYVHDAVVLHEGSASTARHSGFYTYHGHRNLVWTFFKNMPWPLLLIYLPQHIALNILSILHFSMRGRGRVIMKAKLDALKGLPGVLRKRKEVQRNATAGSRAILSVISRGPSALFRQNV